jgi:hypothetical protein
MAIRSGLSNQFGFVKEVTYGTSVAPTKFLPVYTANFDLVQNFVQGGGMFSGDFGPRAAQNVLTTVGGTGSLTMDVQNKDMGLLIQALMGTTVTPVIQGGGPAYLQTHTLADPFGKSLTCQTSLTQQTDGVSKPYTLLGAKVISAEFTAQPGDLFKVAFELDAQNLVESTALASVSYATGLTPFSGGAFGQGTGIAIKTGTVASETLVDGITQITCKINRQSKTDDYRLGNSGKKAEPILNALDATITGTISADYVDKTKFADLWAAGTTTSLVIEAVGVNIASTFNYTFRITVPGIKFTDTGTPDTGGPDVINSDFPYVWVYDGTNLPKIEIIELATTL